MRLEKNELLLKYLVMMIYIVFFFINFGYSEILTLPQTSYKRCTESKDVDSCFELGYFYQRTSKPGDISLGNQYVKYGCKLEKKRSCSLDEANKLCLLRIKSKKDFEKQIEKYFRDMPTIKTEDELSCEKGVAQACGRAANYFLAFAKVINPEKAKALFVEGCQLGDKSSCRSVDLINKGIIRIYEVEM